MLDLIYTDKGVQSLSCLVAEQSKQLAFLYHFYCIGRIRNRDNPILQNSNPIMWHWSGFENCNSYRALLAVL